MTVQLFHKKDKSNIIVDCSAGLKMTCMAIGTTRTGIRPTMIEIAENDSEFSPRFKCSTCKEDVTSLEDLIALCNNCGSPTPVTKLERLIKAGAIICPTCKETNFKEEPSKSFSKLLINMTI